MQIHKLKVGEEYLNNLLCGHKKVEVRFNDRDYQKGDVLKFTHYVENFGGEHFMRITHIHSGIGMLTGFVGLSVVNISESEV